MDLEFSDFAPSTGTVGTVIAATLAGGIPDSPVAAIPMGAVFRPEGGEGQTFRSLEVIIQDNVPGGFSQYAITIPADATVGDYIFEVMVRCKSDDKTQPEYLAKIHSEFTFQVKPEVAARLSIVQPSTVEQAKFYSETFTVRGVNLDQIDIERTAYLNNPGTGRMRIQQLLGNNTLRITASRTGFPPEPNRYRVLAYLKTGEPCFSTAYLTIE